MIGAALYLSRRSLANSLKRRLARLRQPQYAVGLIVGVLYLASIVGTRRRGTITSSPGAEALGVCLLTIYVMLNWVLGDAETPFTFTLAETQFLFSAPLTRSQVIRFKILRMQITLLLSAAFTVLIFSSRRFSGAGLLHALALWLIYGTLQLHAGGVGLLRATLADHGIAGVRRRLGALAVVAALIGLGWWATAHQLADVVSQARDDVLGALGVIDGALHTGALAILSWPARALVNLYLANTVPEFAAALPAALLVFAVHLVWVVRSTVSFEEAAVEHAAKFARRIDAMRRGRGYAPARAPGTAAPRLLRLGATGVPAVAILWKNVLGTLREIRPRTIVLIVVMCAVMAFATGGDGLHRSELFAVLAGFLCLLAVGAGPFAVRYDFRRDLELVALLKVYPLRGRQMVAGEIAAPIALLTAFAWGAFLAAFLATLTNPALPPLRARIPIAAAIAVTIPAVLLVLVLVQNAAVLLLPAWMATGQQRTAGLEAMGQRIVVMIGTMFALIVALVPASIVGGGAFALAGVAGMSTPLATLAGAILGS
ncbi:MAG TPA: putative ABC exporter domain-containing protein, partial [Gemmatimonadales bacterium]|nr:putative ABC exporter domain-containing protein [Gemmatimonadales bacterium]